MSLNQLIEEMFRPGYDPVAAIIDFEIKRGFTVIRPAARTQLSKGVDQWASIP